MRRRKTPEIVAGRVAATGAVIAGDGFTVFKFATGTYHITIPDFKLLSAVGNMQVWETGGSVIIDTTTPTLATFRLLTFNTGGGGVDKAFNFVAVGIRQ